MYFIKLFFKQMLFNSINKVLDFKKNYNKKIGTILDITKLSKEENKALYNLIYGFCVSVATTKDVPYFSSQSLLASIDNFNSNSSKELEKTLSLEFYYDVTKLFWFEILLIHMQIKLVN